MRSCSCHRNSFLGCLNGARVKGIVNMFTVLYNMYVCSVINRNIKWFIQYSNYHRRIMHLATCALEHQTCAGNTCNYNKKAHQVLLPLLTQTPNPNPNPEPPARNATGSQPRSTSTSSPPPSPPPPPNSSTRLCFTCMIEYFIECTHP